MTTAAKPLSPEEIADIASMRHNPSITEWCALTRTVGGETRALPSQVESAREAALIAGDRMACELVAAQDRAERYRSDLSGLLIYVRGLPIVEERIVAALGRTVVDEKEGAA